MPEVIENQSPLLLRVESKTNLENEKIIGLEETSDKEDILSSELLSSELTEPQAQPKIFLQRMDSESVISEIEITVKEEELDLSSITAESESGTDDCKILCVEAEVESGSQVQEAEISNIEEVSEPISQSGNSQEKMEEQTTEQTTEEETEENHVEKVLMEGDINVEEGEENRRKELEEEEGKRKEIEEEEQKRKVLEEEERKRKEMEEEEQRRKVLEEEERKRKEEEEKARQHAEEAEKRRIEELERKKAEEEKKRLEEKRRVEEERKREEDLKRAAEEEAKRAAEEARVAADEAQKLEEFDSFDVIGELVDKENKELARQRREASSQRKAKISNLDSSLVGGKEKAELGKELWEASNAGKAGPVRMLLQAGADPNFIFRTGLMSSSSPLVTASCRGHSSVVTCLLESPHTDVNLPVSGGWTALMWASWYGQTEIVHQLLAVPDIRKDQLNQAGKNAVMYGAEAGRVEVCRILLDGVENYDADEEDRAVRKNRLDKLLDQALKAGCDVPLAKMVLGNKINLQYLVLSIENLR